MIKFYMILKSSSDFYKEETNGSLFSNLFCACIM